MSFSKKSASIARKKHLLIVQYYFPPMGGGGVQRIVKFLKYLDYQRFQVTVLTVKPSYFYSFDETLLAEIPDSVRVVRSGSLDPFRIAFLFQKLLKKLGLKRQSRTESARESGGLLRKFAAAFFVPDSRLMWLPFALFRARGIHRRDPVNFLLASMPPFTTGLIGILAGRLAGFPTVLDFRDAWIDNPYMPASGAFQQRLNERLESFCLKRAAGVLFINPALQAAYLRRHPSLTGTPLLTIRNGYDEADFSGLADPGNPKREKLVVGIMGTIYSEGNRPLTLLDALAMLVGDGNAAGRHIELQILGKWTPDFQEHLQRLGLGEKVALLPYRPHREALAYAQTHFDALALAIETGRSGDSAVVPGRIYEYLRLGKPILGTCPPSGDLAELIRQNRAGEVVAYEDVAGIAGVLESWYGKRARLAEDYPGGDLTPYERGQQTAALMTFLEKL
ncbi:MAG: hypothetical protein KDI06_00875 [Calditrichaeota bacterium]|nr:hypothetical protein [Calditrichota bacterium]HQU70835.1 glycosyltransferase [Calditrichia bacterium]